MRRLAYIWSEAFTNIRCNRTTTVVAIVTTAFTLACFGIFALLYMNLHQVTGALKGDIRVLVYLEDGLAGQAVMDIQRRLRGEVAVAGVLFISKEQALEEFHRQFPAEQHLLQGLGENPLPASFIVTIKPEYGSPEVIRELTQRVGKYSGIVQVQYSREWLEHLNTLIGFIELAAIIVGTVLSGATVTVVASTIRLALYARREEIDILRLSGADQFLIKVPYLLEGALLGIVGGFLSLLMLRGGFEYVVRNFSLPGRFLGVESSLQFFPSQMTPLLVLGGLGLGFAGSFVSLIRFEYTRI